MAQSRSKDALTGLLGEPATPQEIRRGRGVHLSTEVPEEVPAPQVAAPPIDAVDEPAQTHKRTNAQTHQTVRVNRGYALREEYIKQLKRIAIEEDRKLYEVMDDALAQYLRRRHGDMSDPAQGL